jgi:hypothetical protein
MMYEILTEIHVGFTIIALVSGIVAMAATPKGSTLHKRSGIVYFYAFIGIIGSAAGMVCLKYKDLFLGITIFNSYLLFTGYRVLKHKHAKPNGLVWTMLAIFFCGGLLLLVGALKVDDQFFEQGYKWSAVRAFFALLTFYIVVKDFRSLRKKVPDKKSWLYIHMEKMLFTYISLISGVALRLMDHLPVKDAKWLCWIMPYVICIPLIVYWMGKYQSNKVKTLLKE